jgi:hypothetical protein
MTIIARPVIHATQQASRMIKKIIIFHSLILIFYTLSGSLFAQDDQLGIGKISYISKENIYVDKGKKTGLVLGDTLTVKRDGEIIANLHVQYVAENSASCLILNLKENPHIGDMVEFTLRSAKRAETDIAIVPFSRPTQDSYEKNMSTKQFARISGGLSLQWFHYEDQSGNNLNFDQPTVGFDLRAKELWGKKYYFVIKMRVRKNQRTRNYSTGIEEEEWRNRIYSFYFSYEDNESPINYRIGRILTPNLRGVGYLDGLQLQHNISKEINWGVYGGLQSSWQFATTEDSLKKYGVFVSYNNGGYTSNRFAATIAYNAIYHEQTVSRKNIYVQSSFNSKNGFSIFQSMEIDFNTSWREEKENQPVSLTSFYLSARYRISNMVRTGINYDNRKNYYRYETREIPEDFYDLAYRHGLSADLSLTLPQDYYTSFRFGIKKRQDDSETTTIGRFSLRKNNLFFKYLTMNFNFNGYINYYTKGWIPSLYLSKQITGGHYLSLNGGLNKYEMKFDGQKRSRYWLRLNGRLQMFGRSYLSGYYSHEWGDDFKGYRVLAEIGYRF